MHSRIRICLADPFDGLGPAAARDALHIMGDAAQYTWMVATRRPEEIRRVCAIVPGGLPRNVALGIVAANESEFMVRVPRLLLATVLAPAFTFAFCPLVAPIGDMTNALGGDIRIASRLADEARQAGRTASAAIPALGWVLAGGHDEIVEPVRRQCRRFGTPFARISSARVFPDKPPTDIASMVSPDAEYPEVN
jgi:protein gp37